MWYPFLSYPPVDDRAGPWNTAMNAACVLHITWQLYHIGHVTSIVFHCFQGRPHRLAQLTSLWRHGFSPDTQSATVRRSIFRNLFRPLFSETVFYGIFGVVLRFVLSEQTKLLDAEFKYLIIFFNLSKINFAKLKQKIIHHLINTINMREKYSFIGCHWIYGHSTRGVSKSCKTRGKPRVLHDFDTPRVEWPYIQWQPMKESYINLYLCTYIV